MRRKQRSSVPTSVSIERDPASVPGKPFLEHLDRALNGYSDTIDWSAAKSPTDRMLKSQGGSMRQLMINQHAAAAKLDLSVNAPCLCYLQKLFHAMLTPTTSEYSGMITQWRLNAAFAHQLEDTPDVMANLGAASPQRILQLAGRLLEVHTLRLEALPADVNLPMPSECDLLMFPKLSRLHLDRVDLKSVTGFANIADTLTELHYANGTLDSLATLLDRSNAHVQWRNLRSFSVDNVRVVHVEVDTVALAPNLETAAFRKADLADFGGLVRCAWLSVIDLSHNHLHTLDIPAGSFDQLKVLNLSHNHISSIHSLQGCPNLEAIDLGHNFILSLDHVRELAVLERLQSVVLLGNPVSTLQMYRQNARRLLSDEVIVDRVPWAMQDFEEFTRGSDTFRCEEIADEETDQVGNAKQNDNSTLRLDVWSTGRKILRSCLAIGFAQAVVSAVWSRDAESERLTWWILVATACLGGISMSLALTASWATDLCRSKLVAPRDPNERAAIEGDSSINPESSIRAITGRFSATLTVQEKDLLDADAGSSLHIDSLSESLHGAVRAGDDLSLDLLEDVCSQLKTILAFLSGSNGDGFGFAWLRLNRAMISFDRNAPSDLSRSELIRDRLSSRLAQVLDAAEPSASFATSLTKILPVIRLCAIMLSSITPESDSSQVLSDAYVQVFASHHQWLRQRSILSGISHAPRTDAFLEWLGSAHAPSHRHVIEILHKCGERLHLLHGSIQELVDEHLHSSADNFRLSL